MALYFIAIAAPPEVDREVLRFKHSMLDQYGCKVALRSPAHITLVPPFNLPDAQRELLERALLGVAAGVEDFEVVLKNFAAFPPRVIYVDVVHSKPLQQVQALLERHLLPLFPVKKSTRPFHPHVTIANRDLDKLHFAEAWNHFSEKDFTAAFSAAGLSLLRYDGTRWQIVYGAPFAPQQYNSNLARF